MVNGIVRSCLILAVQRSDKALIEQLEPNKRAAVLLAMFALVVTGLALVLGIMIGAHWVRRMARQRPRGGSPPPSSRGTGKPGSPPSTAPSGPLPDVGAGSTIQIDAATSETKLND